MVWFTQNSPSHECEGVAEGVADERQSTRSHESTNQNHSFSLPFYMFCRHPDPSQRPKFSEIYSLLHSSGLELLTSAAEEGDKLELQEQSPTACTGSSVLQWQIGATLEDRDNKMFVDLQTLYRDSHS